MHKTLQFYLKFKKLRGTAAPQSSPPTLQQSLLFVGRETVWVHIAVYSYDC